MLFPACPGTLGSKIDFLSYRQLQRCSRNKQKEYKLDASEASKTFFLVFVWSSLNWNIICIIEKWLTSASNRETYWSSSFSIWYRYKSSFELISFPWASLTYFLLWQRQHFKKYFGEKLRILKRIDSFWIFFLVFSI